jgi:hypothetical protein
LPLLQTTYKDGKEDGLWEELDKDGQLRGRENWIDGKIEGLSEFYRNGEEDKCRARGIACILYAVSAYGTDIDITCGIFQ